MGAVLLDTTVIIDFLRGREGARRFLSNVEAAEDTAYTWISGEILTHYRDWKIEWCAEEIFDCMSSGVPHQHAVNRIIARKEMSQPDGRPNAA